MLNEALRKHLQGRPAGPADLWLAHAERSLTVDVEPLGSGWQIRIPDAGEPNLSARSEVVDTLKQTIGWDASYSGTLTSSPQYPVWVWLPASSVSGIIWRPHTPAVGIDYRAKAREAWAILRARAIDQATMTYGDLGHALGGLHPLHDVPQVLDIIQTWCHDHQMPDLTGLVVSQRTGLPGRDYWRQNGWADLATQNREVQWRESLTKLAANLGPEEAPI
ncbi:MAG: hypothetical protein M1415_07300 [Firmicutes bacterium]|nr:hypothetical protein [Bacillota bacterium]MCL5064040.1 hypothetical protein [Bacillota bacterium]